MMQATDLQSSNQLPPVAKQALERHRLQDRPPAMDWQTVVSRRAKKDAPDKGGWNIFSPPPSRSMPTIRQQLLHQRRLRQGVVRLAVRPGDGEVAGELRA